MERKFSLNEKKLNINYVDIINEPIFENDLEGPENIHILLVDLIQKGKKKMNELSYQFNEHF